MIHYRSQQTSQSNDSIEKATTITLLGDDVSLLDDPMVNVMDVDHVRQQLETLVGAMAYSYTHLDVVYILYLIAWYSGGRIKTDDQCTR